MPIPEAEILQIREETIRCVIRHFLANAKDPGRIGRRVLMWDFALKDKERREKLRSFAASLNVSESSACESVADAEAAIYKVRNPNSH